MEVKPGRRKREWGDEGGGREGENERGRREEASVHYAHAVIELQSLWAQTPGWPWGQGPAAMNFVVLKTAHHAQRQAARSFFCRSMTAAGGGTAGARSGAGGQVICSKLRASAAEMKRVRPA